MKKKLLFSAAFMAILLWGATTGNIQWTQIRSTDRHGTDTKGQSSDGTGTSGNLAKYNSGGGLTDGPALPLSVANGGSGTSTPSLVAGTNVTITGSWPNQTVAASGGGGSSFPFTLVQEATFQPGNLNTTSYTVTFPQTTAASGNTSFMAVSTDGSQAITAPTGWTVDINQAQATYARFMLLHKTTASDTSATFTTSAATNYAVYFFELVGSHALDQSSSGGIANAFVVPVPAITPSANSVVFCMAAFVIEASAQGPYQYATETVSPFWKTLSVSSGFNGGGARGLAGHVSTQAAAHVSTVPPAISLPLLTFFASGGIAYASFSIL